MGHFGFTSVLRGIYFSKNSVIDSIIFHSLIEWEWKVGYKPSHSQEKLVSHGFHTRLLKPDVKGFQYGGFT